MASLLDKLKTSWRIRKAKTLEKKGDYNGSIHLWLDIGRPAGAMYVYQRAEESGHYKDISISTEYEVLSAAGVKPEDIYKIINDRLPKNVTVTYGGKIIAGDKDFFKQAPKA